MERTCRYCQETKEIHLFPPKSWKCRSCKTLHKKNYYLKFPEKKKEVDKSYYEKNKSSRIKRQNERAKERRKTDPMFRAIACLRSRLGMALTDWHKSKPTMELLGCSKEELKIHLESKFQDGMSWENHGIGRDKWHIDHIIPLSKAQTLLELEQLFHCSNLQPLWGSDNIKKSNK